MSRRPGEELREATCESFAHRGDPVRTEQLRCVLLGRLPVPAPETIEEAVYACRQANPSAKKNEVYRAVTGRGLKGANKRNVLSLYDKFDAAKTHARSAGRFAPVKTAGNRLTEASRLVETGAMHGGAGVTAS